MQKNTTAYTLGLVLLITLVACGPKPTLSPTIAPTPTAQPVPAGALVITNGSVIDGSGADPIPDGVVIIQGNRILAVGQAARFSIPPEAQIIDAGGGIIMPGIINSHVHATHTPEIRRRFLRFGVTTVCDLGAPLSAISMYEQDRTPDGPAARGFWAGPIITVPGGYRSIEDIAYNVATPEEAQAAVVDLLGRGVDVIKIALEPGGLQHMPVLEKGQVQAIVEEAHTQGALVRAHVSQETMLDIVLETGVDVIEHLPIPTFQEGEFQSILEAGDTYTLPPEYQAQLARLADQGVIMVPTLDVLIGMDYRTHNRTPDQQLYIDICLEIVRRFHELGGIVALGNDFGNSGVQSGMPLREMELLLAAGLTPMEVIEAGTRHAAYVCGHGDELGTLEPGKLADVIVVDGNPLADIKTLLLDVAVVIKDGEIAFTQE